MTFYKIEHCLLVLDILRSSKPFKIIYFRGYFTGAYIIWICRVIDVPIPQQMFFVRPVSTVRPSSVNYNLRGRYHTISGYNMLLRCNHGLTTEICLTIKKCCPIGTSITLHFLMMNFHCIDEKKIIAYIIVFKLL